MDLILQDLRHSLRSLKKSPLFTGTAIFCLTLSIGAVSAIFSVFNAVLLDAYPFAEPDALIDIQIVSRDFQFENPNDATFTMPQRALDPFMTDARKQVFGWKADQGFAITELETSISLLGDVVSTNYFDLVRPEMRLGRLFSAQDKDQPVVVLSYRQWLTTFGKDPDILGKSLTVDGTRHTIVGVLERDHRYPAYSDIWIPERSINATGSRLESRQSYNIMTRLAADQSIEQLNHELLAISDQFIEIDSGLFSRYMFHGFAVPKLLARGARLGETLHMLMASVIALLLIASANVANLMLSRMQQQEQELSLRAALGARRGRLVRRLLMESGIIAFGSAVSGILLAYLMLPVFVEQAGQILNPERVRINAGVLIFSLLITILTTLFVSLAPLVRVLSADLASTLRAGGNKGMMGGGAQLRQVLVTGEAALTFMLLVGAGLMIKSFAQIQSVDMGFAKDNLQTFVLYAPQSRSGNHQQAMQFYEQIRQEISAVPGVISVAFSQALPVQDRSTGYSMSIEDFPPENPDDLITPAPTGEVSSDNYLQVLGVKLVDGRYLNKQDRAEGNQVVIISENMASHYWPNESAVGKRIKRGGYTEETYPWWTIVGVVESMRTVPTAPPAHRFFRTVDQQVLNRAFNDMRIMIRTEGRPGTVMPGVRAAVQSFAVDAVISNELTMVERIENSTRTQQMAMQIVLSFSVIGLVLAVAGIFGVFSYNVQQRFREIGLRMVLGARTHRIFTLVLRSAVGLGALGLGIGFMLTLSARDYIEGYLFEVSTVDPFVYITVAAILMVAIIAAAYVPARRATMTDPVNTLRHS